MSSSELAFPKPPTWKYMPLYEKIMHYKSCLNEKYSPYVDKLEAKEIVKRMCADDIAVAKIIRILENPDDFHESDINENHIIKAAHGCGWNISMTKDTTVESVRASLHSWNHIYNPSGEAQYKFIIPRFFIEEKINDSTVGITGSAIVYMFRCIHGNPISIGVKYNEKQNSYDLNWIPLKEPELPFTLTKPDNLNKMISLAKRLSAPFEFVRIDFYNGADSNIYFSEFTFSPAAGHRFFSMEKEREFGRLWR